MALCCCPPCWPWKKHHLCPLQSPALLAASFHPPNGAAGDGWVCFLFLFFSSFPFACFFPRQSQLPCEEWFHPSFLESTGFSAKCPEPKSIEPLAPSGAPGNPWSSLWRENMVAGLQPRCFHPLLSRAEWGALPFPVARLVPGAQQQGGFAEPGTGCFLWGTWSVNGLPPGPTFRARPLGTTKAPPLAHWHKGKWSRGD